MRLKEIKPGMVIHCKTEEEARFLRIELDKLGYRWVTNHRLEDSTIWNKYDNICLHIQTEGQVTWSELEDAKGENYTITEFSDLIIPELSAKEVLETMKEICKHHDCQCHRCSFRGSCDPTEDNSDKIIEICTKWREEHPKDEEKKVEVEQFWEIKCLEDPSYHTTEHYKDEAEALRMCVILAEKDPKNSYYAVFVAKAKE